MTFKFNLNSQSDNIKYRAFYGEIPRNMPRLLANGFKPMSVAQMMKRRLGTDKFHWDAFSYISGDAVIYHPDGRMKVVRDAKPLRKVNRRSELEFEYPHRLELADGVYESLEGLELTPKEQRGVISAPFIPFNPRRVRSNVIWQYLARSQDLLDEFIDTRIVARKKEWYYDRSMQVNFNPACIIDLGNPGLPMYGNLLAEVKKPLLEAIEFEEMRDGGNACIGNCGGFLRNNVTLIGLRKKSKK